MPDVRIMAHLDKEQKYPIYSKIFSIDKNSYFLQKPQFLHIFFEKTPKILSEYQKIHPHFHKTTTKITIFSKKRGHFSTLPKFRPISQFVYFLTKITHPSPIRKTPHRKPLFYCIVKSSLIYKQNDYLFK